MPSEGLQGRYGRYIKNIIVAGDFAVVNITYIITLLILGRYTGVSLREVLMVINVAYIPVALYFRNKHNYRTLDTQYVVRYALLAVISHICIFVLMIYWLGAFYISLRFFITFYPLLALLLATWWVAARMVMKHYRRKGRNFSRVAIVGTGPTARLLYDRIQADSAFGYKFMGFFSDHPESETPAGQLKGKIDDLPAFIASNHIDEVFYTISGEHHDTMHRVINATEQHLAKFYYVPQISRYVGRSFELSSLGSMPVLSLAPQPLSRITNRFLKRAFDIAFSSLFLLISPIIFIPVAIAIKVSSPGPVFFRQLRTGYKGRDFYCWKFRTMRVNNDADTRQATADDPRKTKLGDLLRRTSIDELPQFINVWLGDMSVVGPRPHMLKHTEEYSHLIDRYMVRHYIKPGVTGWAQVCGYRGQTDELWKMEKRVEHDVWYIQHWTFLLDIKIIVRTITNALHGEDNAF